MDGNPARRFGRFSSLLGRRSVTTLVAVVLLPGCGDATPASRIAATIGPLFDNTHQGEISHSFYVQNPSATEVMRLKLAQRSCSCVTSIIGSPEVMPGQMCEITLKTTPVFSSQDQVVSAIYSTDLKTMPQIAASLVVKAHKHMAFDPDVEHIPPLSIAPGSSKQVRIEITVRTPESGVQQPLRVSGSDASAIALKKLRQAVEDGIVVAVYEASVIVTCPLDVDKLNEEQDAIETVQLFEGDTHASDLHIRWRPTQFIDVSPSVLFLSASTGAATTRRLRLSGDSNFKIERVSSSIQGMTSQMLSEEVSKEHEVAVTFEFSADALANRKYREETVTIQTSAVSQPVVRVPVIAVD